MWYEPLSKVTAKSFKHRLLCQIKWNSSEKTNDIKRHLFSRIAYTEIFNTFNKFCRMFGGKVRFVN